MECVQPIKDLKKVALMKDILSRGDLGGTECVVVFRRYQYGLSNFGFIAFKVKRCFGNVSTKSSGEKSAEDERAKDRKK